MEVAASAIREQSLHNRIAESENRAVFERDFLGSAMESVLAEIQGLKEVVEKFG